MFSWNAGTTWEGTPLVQGRPVASGRGPWEMSRRRFPTHNLE